MFVPPSDKDSRCAADGSSGNVKAEGKLILIVMVKTSMGLENVVLFPLPEFLENVRTKIIDKSKYRNRHQLQSTTNYIFMHDNACILSYYDVIL